MKEETPDNVEFSVICKKLPKPGSFPIFLRYYKTEPTCSNCLTKETIYILKGIRRAGLSYSCVNCGCEVEL